MSARACETQPGWPNDGGGSDGAVEQGVEADEAGASDGASQLNSGVLRTVLEPRGERRLTR